MVSASVNEGRSWWVSTNTGVWNGGVVAPPALPVEVLPRAALGPELVAAHDLGADVPGHVAGEVVVEPAGAAGVGAVGPARGGAGPRQQVGRVGVPEGPFEALALAGAEPVRRHAEVLHLQQLGMRVLDRASSGRTSGARPMLGVVRLRVGEAVPVPGDGTTGEARCEPVERGVQSDDVAVVDRGGRGR